MSDQNIVLHHTDPKKRGFVQIFNSMTFHMADNLAFSGLATFACLVGGAESLLKGGFESALTSWAWGAAFGGLAYYQFSLLKKGTCPTKKILKMQVLKFDPKLNGYRRLTPLEFITRQVASAFYFPVAFMFYTGPAMILGALAGGATNVANNAGSREKSALERKIDSMEENAAAAAGAAVGMAISNKLIQKYPWMIFGHDYALKTRVFDVNSEQAKYFEAGGTLETHAPSQYFPQAA